MDSTYVVGAPAPPLRTAVRRYLGYRLDGFGPGVHRGLPSPHLTVILAIDEPLDLAAAPDPKVPGGRFWTLLGGLHSAPVTIRHNGSQHGVQLELTPVGARALCGSPAGALASTVVPLDAVLGHLAGELVDRLAATPSWKGRFAIIDEVLCRALRPPGGIRAEIDVAWRRVVSSGGTAPVTSLAADVGWSRRHLSERFRDEYGLPPKLLARVVRFDRARRMLTTPGHASVAGVAATCGYADQAHLTRDWHQFAGMSPTAWLATEGLPFVQDSEPTDRAPSRS